MKRVFRYSLLFSLLLIVFFILPKNGVSFDKLVYYYPCNKPIAYSISTVDSRFKLSSSDVYTVSENAALIWSKLLDKGIVLCKEIMENESILYSLGIDVGKIEQIKKEAGGLCKT